MLLRGIRRGLSIARCHDPRNARSRNRHDHLLPALVSLSPLRDVSAAGRVHQDFVDLLGHEPDGSREFIRDVLVPPDPYQIDLWRTVTHDERKRVGDDVRPISSVVSGFHNLLGSLEHDRARHEVLEVVAGLLVPTSRWRAQRELDEVLLRAAADHVRQSEPGVLELRDVGLDELLVERVLPLPEGLLGLRPAAAELVLVLASGPLVEPAGLQLGPVGGGRPD